MAFSTMTIAWSTRMPIEMVIPASDMMLAWMSMMCRRRNSHISRNENRTASGSVTQMTKTLRKCMRMSRMASEAMMISCRMTSVSVSMAPWIRRVRS